MYSESGSSSQQFSITHSIVLLQTKDRMAENRDPTMTDTNPKKSERVYPLQALLSPQFLLLAGIAVSAAIVLEGILCFTTTCALDIKAFIVSCYYVIFGLVTVGAEMKLGSFHRWFRIISTNTGRGAWYVFLGTFAIGGQWWAIVIAVALIVVGALNIVAGCKKDSQNNAEEKSKGVNSQNSDKLTLSDAKTAAKLAKKANKANQGGGQSNLYQDDY